MREGRSENWIEDSGIWRGKGDGEAKQFGKRWKDNGGYCICFVLIFCVFKSAMV